LVVSESTVLYSLTRAVVFGFGAQAGMRIATTNNARRIRGMVCRAIFKDMLDDITFSLKRYW